MVERPLSSTSAEDVKTHIRRLRAAREDCSRRLSEALERDYAAPLRRDSVPSTQRPAPSAPGAPADTNAAPDTPP